MVDRQEKFSGTREVRKGFELDQAALQRYMEENVEGFSGSIDIRQFKGGQSNPTYQISAGGKKYALRRKPSGKLLKSAHAVDREYRVITALGQTDVPVPKTYALCTDDSVIGSWFYIMECVEGRGFWTYDSTPKEDRQKMFDAMNDVIAKLHQVDYRAIGLEDFGKEGSYFSRQISRWTKQYQNSVDEPSLVMDELITWLLDHVPDNDETSIVHGDYRMDNMIFHPEEPRILAILDWELSTLGHPLSDFSYHCIIWRIPVEFEGIGLAGVDLKAMNFPDEKEYIEAYCKRTQRDHIDNWNFYMAFNFFRLSAITFGIKGRVRDGTAASEEAKAIAAVPDILAEMGLQQIK